jgi:hypothetical protein
MSASARSRPFTLPSPAELERMVYELESRNRQDVLAARELLRRILKNGRIVLDPQPDRVYLARTEVLPLLLLSEGVRETGNPWVSPGAAFSSACSGGKI